MLLLVGLVVTLALLASPVLAYFYRAPLTVTSNSTTAYTMLPIITNANNSWMAANGFMKPTALDTRVETLAGLVKPHMVADNKTMTAIPVPAGSQTNLYFTTGNSDLSAMYIIPGYNGYVTTNDTAALEMSSNFTDEYREYINMAVSDNIVNKLGALTIRTNAATSNVTANVTATSNVMAIMLSYSGGIGSWVPAQLIDGATGTNGFDTNAAAAGSWVMIDFGAGGAQRLTSWAYYASNATTYAIWNIQYSSDNTTWVNAYIGLSMSAAAGWHKATFSPSPTAKRYWRSYKTDIANVGGFHTELKVEACVEATVTGVSSAETTIRIGVPFWQTGNVLNFDGTANSYADMGVLYNSSPKFFFAETFRLPTAHQNGSAEKYLVQKNQVGINNFYLKLKTDGTLEFKLNVSGAVLITAQNVWTADTAYTVMFSLSNVNGMRFRTATETLTSPAATGGTPAAGNLIIGNSAIGGTNGMVGQIFNAVSCNTTDLTVAQETALLNGLAPAYVTDYWFMDEGAGDTITSYGSAANNGTKGASTTWTTATYTSGQTGRPYEFGLQVGSSTAHARFYNGSTVTDTANNWIWGAGNTVAYWNYIKRTVNGVQVLWYQPNTMILGTLLPDRAGTKNGDITWGGNPANITAVLGGMVSTSQPMPGVSATTTPSDILPETNPSDWFKEPEVAGSLLTNPFRPFVTILSDTTTLTETQAWQLLGLVLIIAVFAGTLKLLRGHLGIACIATSVAIIALVAWTIWPWYTIIMSAVGFGGGILLEKTQSW